MISRMFIWNISISLGVSKAKGVGSEKLNTHRAFYAVQE